MSTHPSASRPLLVRNRGTTPLSGARLQELLGTGTGSGQPLRDSSIVLRDTLPLPGLQEIGATVRSLITNLQATPQAKAERLALERRLQHTAELMKNLAELEFEDFDYYKSQLDHAKSIFDRRMNSGHVSRISKARDDLDVLQDLDLRIDRIIRDAQTDLVCRMVSNQEEENLVKTILPQEITNQFDLSDWLDHMQFTLPATPDMEPPVVIKRRSGNVGSLPVQYVTYHSEKSGVARKVVKETLQVLLQLSHDHISSVVGKTSGFGCNGIVLTAGTLTLHKFIPQVGVREFARCALEFYSAIGYLKQHNDFGQPDHTSLDIGSIQVRDNGSLVIIPKIRDNVSFWVDLRGLPGIMLAQDLHPDPALRILASLLKNMGWRYLRENELKMLRTLSTSKAHWTELQMLKVAVDSDILSYRSFYAFWSGNATPPFKLSLWDAVSITKIHDQGIKMQILDHIESAVWPEPHSHLDTLDPLRGGPRHPKISQDNPEGWVTYLLPRDTNHPFGGISRSFEAGLETRNTFKQIAREYMRKLSMSLSSMHLCAGINMRIDIVRDSELLDAEQLYFHHRPHRASNPADFWGYFSTNPSVEYGAARGELERRGWKISYKLHSYWYRLKDDLELRYERLLEQTMEATPGGFTPPSPSLQEDTDPAEEWDVRWRILEVN